MKFLPVAAFVLTFSVVMVTTHIVKNEYENQEELRCWLAGSDADDMEDVAMEIEERADCKDPGTLCSSSSECCNRGSCYGSCRSYEDCDPITCH